MKHRIGVIVGVLLLLVMSATACSNPATKTTLPMMTNVSGLNSSSSKSANGLSLSLSLDSTTYKRGKSVTIILDETNTLSATNNVHISNNWSYSHLHVASCDFISPFGISVFQGDYTASDFFAATPLTLDNPNITQLCPTIYAITAYSFEPSSDMASIIQISNPNPTGNDQKLRYELTINGYWPHVSNSKLTNFESGVYTVVAGDEWGTLVVLHFTVL